MKGFSLHTFANIGVSCSSQCMAPQYICSSNVITFESLTISPTDTNDGALKIHLMPKMVHYLLQLMPGHFLLPLAPVL
ncbi:unnamed protein product, partial [Staurois parvus]